MPRYRDPQIQVDKKMCNVISVQIEYKYVPIMQTLYCFNIFFKFLFRRVVFLWMIFKI